MKRFFAGCLALILILSLLPGAALGTEAEPQVQTQEEPSAAVQAQVTAEPVPDIFADSSVLDLSESEKKHLTGTLSIDPKLPGGNYSGRIVVKNPTQLVIYRQSFSFTGTSFEYSVALPRDEAGTYIVAVEFTAGEGVLLDKYYYYSANRLSLNESDAIPVSIGTEGAELDLMVPKATQISGCLAGVDGEEIEWADGDKISVWLSPVEEDGIIGSYYAPVNKDGSWTICIAPEITGEYRLSYEYSSTVNTNIIKQTYYYNGSQPLVTNWYDAETLTIGSEDITGLVVYVESGWILSGAICIPDGGYLDGTISAIVHVYDDTGISCYGSALINANGGSYSVLVPKVVSTYTIELYALTLSSGGSTNLFLQRMEQSGVEVSEGNTTGPDFILIKPKTYVTGTIRRPVNSTDTIHLSIYVDASKIYGCNVTIPAGEDSASFSIPVPTSDSMDTFQLYYYTWNTITNAPSEDPLYIYICEDGSQSFKRSNGGFFSFTDSQIFDITLPETHPFVEGRIYCPEDLTETILVYVDYSLKGLVTPFNIAIEDPTYTYTYVGPTVGQVDEYGRRYSTYSLSDLSFGAGTTYQLYYYVAHPGGGIVDTTYQFLNADGSTESYRYADVFMVSEGGPQVVNFTPLLWEDGSEDFILQSPHGIYKNLGTVTYTYTYPAEVESMTVTFSSRTDTNLIINGKTYTAYALVNAGFQVKVTGNTLTIQMKPTNSSSSLAFGFAVTAITPTGGEALEGPAAAAVYTRSGSTGAAILSDLNDGQPVRVSLVSKEIDESTTTTLTGVIYDENGKMLELVQVDVDLTEGSDTATLQFTKNGTAATLKLLLTDGDWIPLMQNLVYQRTE